MNIFTKIIFRPKVEAASSIDQNYCQNWEEFNVLLTEVRSTKFMQSVEFSTRWISSWVVASLWPPWIDYSLCFYRSSFKTKADNNWLFEATFYQVLIPQWCEKQSKFICRAAKKTKYLKNIWQQLQTTVTKTARPFLNLFYRNRRINFRNIKNFLKDWGLNPRSFASKASAHPFCPYALKVIDFYLALSLLLVNILRTQEDVEKRINPTKKLFSALFFIHVMKYNKIRWNETVTIK